jgi:DNA-binding MarR family transcriptional regulator
MTNKYQQLVHFAEQLQAINTFLDTVFIGRHTSLPQAVLLWLAINYLSHQRSPLKTAHLSLRYSEPAIRRYLRQLECDGWVEFNKNSADKRYKEIILTKKFINSFSDFHLHFNRTIYRKR